MPKPIADECQHAESPDADISWTCNRTPGHYPDTDHAYIEFGKARHEWKDQA